MSEGGTSPADATPRAGDPRRAAVRRPERLAPGDGPGLDDRVLVLFDADCGFCLSGRDALARWDRGGALAFDLIQRHRRGLLADLDEDVALESWHAIEPDGTRTSGAAAAATIGRRLPGGGPGASLVDLLPGPAGRAYRLMADHRTAVSRALGTDRHPERGLVPEPGRPR